ncbi:MAG: TolC family protein, partial [Kiritimatiellia bacterium]
RFLVNLGLPSETPATLADDIPDMLEVTLEEQDAVTLALNRRMDVHTTRDRLADAERKVRVARNAYLPEVNLYGESEWNDRDDGATNANADATTSWEAGIRAEIPFDRRAERDAIRRAEIARDAASRALEEKEENTALEVREAYSRLRSLRVSLDVELKNIEIAEKRATNALLEFRNGRLSNRDVVEAANDLLNAKNAYVNALVDYEIQRLTLLRQVGLLDVAREGTLMELSPDA